MYSMPMFQFRFRDVSVIVYKMQYAFFLICFRFRFKFFLLHIRNSSTKTAFRHRKFKILYVGDFCFGDFSFLLLISFFFLGSFSSWERCSFVACLWKKKKLFPLANGWKMTETTRERSKQINRSFCECGRMSLRSAIFRLSIHEVAILILNNVSRMLFEIIYYS